MTRAAPEASTMTPSRTARWRRRRSTASWSGTARARGEPHRRGAVLLHRSPRNANHALKTWACGCASAVGRRLKCHMDPRAGPPPGKDDTVQQGHAAGDAVSPALDERRERFLTDFDLIDCLQGTDRSGDGGRG